MDNSNCGTGVLARPLDDLPLLSRLNLNSEFGNRPRRRAHARPRFSEPQRFKMSPILLRTNLFRGFNGQILKISRTTTSTRTSLNFGFWVKPKGEAKASRLHCLSANQSIRTIPNWPRRKKPPIVSIAFRLTSPFGQPHRNSQHANGASGHAVGRGFFAGHKNCP
jgi:hypothetical protein